MRHITDTNGVEWTVFEVKKQGGVSDRWSYLPEEFGEGWLCFESRSSKRRLTPIPARWREFSDSQLTRLLADAQPVKRTKVNFEDTTDNTTSAAE